MTEPARWVGSVPLEPTADGTCSYWARGYATTADGTVLIDAEIGRELSRYRDRLAAGAGLFNGCFSAVLQTSNWVKIVTDRFGTIPIYRGRDRSGAFSVADDPWRVARELRSSPRLDSLCLVDLLHAGYVTGDRTLIEGIETISPASITSLDGTAIRCERYWTYSYRPEAMDEGAAITTLTGVLSEVVARSNAVSAKLGARPVLTLSGGLDSRLLASLFVNSGSVITPTALSYGLMSDPEVATANEVATALAIGFRNVPVDKSYFNNEFLDQSVREVGMTTRFTCGTGARHFAASPGDVLVPGHTGDFISGGHLPPHAGLVDTRTQLHRFLDLRHFQYPGSGEIIRRVLRVDHRLRFENLARTTDAFDLSEDMFGLIDRWNVENRQRRLILMELRAYEQSAPWLLPFYDYELVDFFARVPHSLRVGQYLYTKSALTKIFVGDCATLGRIRRVGKPLRPDDRTYGRITAFGRVPEILRTPLLAAWPLARGAKQLLRGPAMATSGPDPIRYWYGHDRDVREFLAEQLRAITLVEIDADALLALCGRRDTPDEFFHRIVTSAITAQNTLSLAQRVWSEQTQLRPLD